MAEADRAAGQNSNPTLEFVAEAALRPAEVDIDLNLQAQYERELAAAAAAPLPDEVGARDQGEIASFALTYCARAWQDDADI